MTTPYAGWQRRTAIALMSGLMAAGCRTQAPVDRVRSSGHVEATDVQIAPEVGGRVIEMPVVEGDRVAVGDLIARLDTRDVELSMARARAEREQADAQLRLLEAGARVEDIRQAEAQVAAAEAEVTSVRSELDAAGADLERFEALLRTSSGSQKQRDDAATRRDIARQQVKAAEERLRASREALGRLRAGPRREEVAAARARVSMVDAQIATLDKSLADATVRSPVAGVVTEKLHEIGEIVPARSPLVVVTNLDAAWAEVFIDEPIVPRIRLGQAATVFTDAGGPGIAGKISFISSKAEFTPRNVQTADERSKLVYRIKIAVDNRQGLLKPGMPVEAEIPIQ